MKMVKVTKKSDDYAASKRLYKKAFPAKERAPFWILMNKNRPPVTDFWAFHDKNQYVGFTYIVKYQELVYIFYLAMETDKRGRGYGTKAIEALKTHYAGKRIFLALETLDKTADNYEQRVKRHAFYKKCGLSDIPYQLKEASVIYSLMGIGRPVEPEEYRAMMENYLGGFFSRLVDLRIIRNAPDDMI